MKKIEIKPALRKDDMNDNISKLPRVPAPKRDSEDLTCSEGQVEDLLSGGESTETESEEEKTAEMPASQNASSRKTASTNAPRPRQK